MVLFKKIFSPITLLLCSVTLNSGVVSQTLQHQLQIDRSAFEEDLNSALATNDIIALDNIEVPRPSNLNKFVRNEKRLLELGKALFWDEQVSTDGVMACATCHNAGGADNRAINTISFAQQLKNQDGSNDGIVFSFENDNQSDEKFSPNIQLNTSNFPRNLKSDPKDFLSSFIRETNTVVGSSGIHHVKISEDGYSTFVELDPSDFKLPFKNSSFKVNTRRVGGRNAPTVINAVFNHRQFWDGSANNIFNGVTPFGPEDTGATVFIKKHGDLKQIKVQIDHASLASQATGPVNSIFEMSADGSNLDASFQHNMFITNINRRELLSKRPLAKQKVSKNDSVLGKLARKHAKGLKIKNYKKMIKRAFRKKWWSAEEAIVINPDGSRSIFDEEVDEESYSQLEMNIPLFFGLALYKYESTLVGGQTRVDDYLNGDKSALTDKELIGFRLAAKEARCLNCHGGAEFTYASVSRIEGRDGVPAQGLTRNRHGNLIDEGFNNIGVTPTLDDLGVGAIGPKVNNGQAIIFSNARKELLNNPTSSLTLGSDGAMKIPTLRNVALTAPYFHNGGESNLKDVVDFYLRGGNYRSHNENSNSGFPFPIIGFDAERTDESEIDGLGILTGPHQNSFVGLNTPENGGLDSEDRDNIVAFLKALTDERVKFSKAPFDHPSLKIPVGHVGNSEVIQKKKQGMAKDKFFKLHAVGEDGTTEPSKTFIENL